MTVSRATFDILGPMPVGQALQVQIEQVRKGPRVELTQATLSSPDRTLLVGRIWRIRRSDNVAARTGAPQTPPPLPSQAEDGGISTFGYGQASDWRFVSGSFGEPGPATVWNRVTRPLIDEELCSPVERILMAVDAGSGVGSQLEWDEFLFPNVDLTLHVARAPHGDWICIDSAMTVGGEGAGFARTVAMDTHGVCATSMQSLFIDLRPNSEPAPPASRAHSPTS